MYLKTMYGTYINTTQVQSFDVMKDDEGDYVVKAFMDYDGSEEYPVATFKEMNEAQVFLDNLMPLIGKVVNYMDAVYAMEKEKNWKKVKRVN